MIEYPKLRHTTYEQIDLAGGRSRLLEVWANNAVRLTGSRSNPMVT
jgi:hypothetical protein